MRAMNFWVWERRYQPQPPPVQLPGQPDNFWTLEQVQGQPPERVWTLLDCDGVLYLASGFHFVNRTRDYFVCAIPHDFTDRAVRY
jgi:hypothetical protein